MSDDLLPPNALPQERALSRAMARIGGVPVPIAAVWRPEDCPVELLPWLAWTFGVTEEWALCATEAARRQVIADALELHKYKGTPFAVRRALAAMGVTAGLAEWWQRVPEGHPHTFGVEVVVTDHLDPGGVMVPEFGPAVQAALVRAIDGSKAARSHFDLTLKSELPQSMGAAVAAAGHESLATAGALAGRGIRATSVVAVAGRPAPIVDRGTTAAGRRVLRLPRTGAAAAHAGIHVDLTAPRRGALLIAEG